MNLQEHHEWPASKAVMSTYDTNLYQHTKWGLASAIRLKSPLILFTLGPPKLFLAAAAPVKIPKVKACLCLHSTVSTPWDCSTCLTVHSLADLFIPTPFVLIWESDFVMSWLYLVSSVSWRATPRTVMFMRKKRRVVVGYGLSEEFKVNIG